MTLKNFHRVHSDWAHLLMTLDTCSVTDRRFEIMTPSMVIVVTREIPGRIAGLQSWALRLLCIVNTISSYFPVFTLDYYSVPMFNMIKFCFSWLNVGRYNYERVIRVYCTLVQSTSGCDGTRQLCCWCMTQDRPLTLVQCWQWCLI